MRELLRNSSVPSPNVWGPNILTLFIVTQSFKWIFELENSEADLDKDLMLLNRCYGSLKDRIE